MRGRLPAEAFEYLIRLKEGLPNGKDVSSVRLESGGYGRPRNFSIGDSEDGRATRRNERGADAA